MKSKRLISRIICVLLCNPLTVSFADEPIPIPIPVLEIGEESSTIIRGPEQSPIVCYLSGISLQAAFLYAMGSVSAEIENESTGEYSQTTINATQGVHPFLISGNAGHWTITFTISSGVVYYGEFDIIY